MATTRVKRPPAVFRYEPSVQPEYAFPLTAPGIGHGAGNPVTFSGEAFTYLTQYVVNVNPIKEHPQLDVTSLRQPISVAGWRRNVLTGMGTPFLQRVEGSVLHAGHMAHRTSQRQAMAGVNARGFTYSTPAQNLGPGAGRTVRLGRGSGPTVKP